MLFAQLDTLDACPTLKAAFIKETGVTPAESIARRVPTANSKIVWSKVMSSNSGSIRYDCVNGIHASYLRVCQGGVLPSGRDTTEVFELIYADWVTAKAGEVCASSVHLQKRCVFSARVRFVCHVLYCFSCNPLYNQYGILCKKAGDIALPIDVFHRIHHRQGEKDKGW